MTVAVLGVPAARSRQEVVELIGFIGQAGEELERIADDDLERQVVQAKARACDEASQPIKAAVAEAQEKVKAWFGCNRNKPLRSSAPTPSRVIPWKPSWRPWCWPRPAH